MNTVGPHLMFLCTTAVLVASSSVAVADEPSHLGYEVRALAAVTPGSLNISGDLLYHHAIYSSSDPLFAHNEVTLQIGLGLSPASLRPSVRLAVQPLSILRLWIQYEGEAYFGTSGFARSFPSPASDYGRGVLSSPPAGVTGPYSLWVNRFEIGVRPQIQLGHWLARSSWRAVRYDANLASGDRVLYDPWVDNVVYAHGWSVVGDTDVAYEVAPDRTVIGMRLRAALVFYPDAAFPAGASHDNLNSPSISAGPFIRVPLLQRDTTHRLQELFFTALTEFYVVDRFHAGATTSAAMPLIALSLTASGDL